MRLVAGGLIILGLLLRLTAISEDPLHPDECLYASWAAAVWPGGDLLLRGVVIDKPPVFPYLLAAWSQLVGAGPTALRLLGALSAMVGMLCIFRMAQGAVGSWAAVAGLVLAALSPAAVALDATAFTDPPAVALALLSATLAGGGRMGAAGVLLGLAAATKPTVVAFLPLVLAVAPSLDRRALVRLSGGAGIVTLAVIAWEWVRAPEVGFLSAALAHYGVGVGISFDAGAWWRLLRWVWGRQETVALWGLLAAAGVAVSLRHRSAAARLLWGSLAAGGLYLITQMTVSAPAWDRYLLPMVALTAPATAGALGCLVSRLQGRWRSGAGVGVTVLLALLMLAPAKEAAQGRLPLGDTSAWAGIDSVAAYFRGRVPGRATVLYHDLGWHIRYYMAGFPQDFLWYRTPDELVSAVGEAEPVYLLASAGDTADADTAHLRAAGFEVESCLVTYRYDGTPALAVYTVSRAAP